MSRHIWVVEYRDRERAWGEPGPWNISFDGLYLTKREAVAGLRESYEDELEFRVVKYTQQGL